MAQNSKSRSTRAPAAKSPSRALAKPAYTLERAIALCPNASLAAALERNFALEGVEFHAIRETTEETVAKSADIIRPNMNDQALEIHLQRIVGSFVASACGAGDFYSAKVTAAKDLTSRLANDSRDEDREPVYGFESRAQRAREFAAQVGLQAYALLAAAQGAVDAYAHATGSDWKPFQQSQPADRNVARQAAEAELAAFDIR
jgi:hypothetical protein